MNKKQMVFLGIMALLAGTLLIKGGSRFFGKAEASQVRKVPVAVEPVQRRLVEETLELTGDVRGMNEARVYPKVPGRLLRKIKDSGDTVKKGEVLALIDRDEPALKFAAAEVTSPLDGVLTRYFLDLGQNVTAATPICEVAEVAPVKLVVRVTERDFPKLRIGMPARFTADPYPGKAFYGRVIKIANALDGTTRAADVEIEAENPGNRLKPGMFARVGLIVASRPGALTISREALAPTGETRSVFVATDGGVARERPIKLGEIKESFAEVVSGLAEGEQVITMGWHNLSDGTTVTVTQ